MDKGDNSELCWIDWFNKYLPKRYKANKATIIDSRGNKSEQIDIVIYDAQYSYLAFNQNGILYLPAESVYSVFEVKQNLNKTHMEYAGKKVQSVRKLYRTSAPIPYANGIYEPKNLHRILGGILVSNSDWSEPFGNAWKDCILSLSEDQQVDCGCILSRGSFFYNYSNRQICKSSKEEALVYFYLKLLIELQKMGTVPAIDLNAYMSALSVDEGEL